MATVDETRKMRSVEEAALAILIERLPEGTTERALRELMNEDAAPKPERDAATELAVEGLIAVGLLVRDGDVLEPTPAARRSVEFDFGL